MAITDEEALAWADERERDAAVPPSDEQGPGIPHAAGGEPAHGVREDGTADGPAGLEARAEPEVELPPATIVPAEGRPDTGAAGAVLPRRELSVVLTLIPGEGADATWRAVYTVGAEGAPYPVQMSAVAADPGWAAAQIPRRIVEAEARWRAQPALPKAASGAPAPATPAPARPTGADKARAKPAGKAAPRAGDAGRLAAALLKDTAATPATSADGAADLAGTADPGPAPAPTGTAAVSDLPAPAPTELPGAGLKPSAEPNGQLKLFG